MTWRTWEVKDKEAWGGLDLNSRQPGSEDPHRRDAEKHWQEADVRQV